METLLNNMNPNACPSQNAPTEYFGPPLIVLAGKFSICGSQLSVVGESRLLEEYAPIGPHQTDTVARILEILHTDLNRQSLETQGLDVVIVNLTRRPDERPTPIQLEVRFARRGRERCLLARLSTP